MSVSSTTTTPDTEQTLPTFSPSSLSKNAQKRILKQQKWEATRALRKEVRKEKEKKKKARKQEQQRTAEGDKDSVKPREPPLKKQKIVQTPSTMKVIIDLDFDDYMSDKEIVDLSAQLTRCYSYNNNKTVNPVGLFYTSFSGRLQERFDTRLKEYHNWKNVIIENKPYLELFPNKQDLVYLTADDEEVVLQELDESKIYIIGGIVDKNRHKRLCYHKAKLEGIATAKLPIIFEILVDWLETKNWRETLLKVIPPRKFHPDSKKQRRETAKKNLQLNNEDEKNLTKIESNEESKLLEVNQKVELDVNVSSNDEVDEGGDDNGDDGENDID
ncbi:8683_t:CDS:2 [Ambispora gerdemannii]|uniref:tRNA (guanine(9)-N1)-methyltransferase n=1 Tax=Ambispora gerdemannii TaxID=144530 RepID=A0A9N9F046_9GLOM|nr:8683_t:CDS:2 [Ambispora gerdemannii]